ncbi:MAG: hypothetical protein RBR97_18815 [Bacteroidales bacterium]|nr:hypothetical protein [Bacteroidales bacterium]
MKNLLIIIALLVFLLASCDFKDKNELCLEPILDIHFKTEMAFYPNDAGCFMDLNSNKEYFYFCNQTTERRIDIFDPEGNFIDTIDIKKALNKIGETVSLTVISMDTILISTFYTNELIAINSNGDIWFYLNIDSIFPEEIKEKNEFWALPQTSFSCNRKNLYYKASPKFGIIVSEDSSNNHSIEDYNLMFYKKHYNSPYFFKLSNYLSDNIDYEFGLGDIYHQICEENSDFSEYPKYRYLNDKLIFYSTFSNCLFIINPDNFELEEKVELNSKFTNIGTPAVVLSKDSMFVQMDKTSKAIIKAGRIISVLYDSSHYYIPLKHQDLMPVNLNKSKYLSFFSVIVLNDDFVFVDEFLFDAKEYDQYSGMMTQKGLAFQKTNIQNGKTYTIFNLF